MILQDDGHIITGVVQAARAGKPVCLAYVADTWGSAPRAVGSCLSIFADGSFEGSVSGGCIEADVITSALHTIETRDVRFLRKDFGIADETAWEAGLACGGKMQVLIVPILDEPTAAPIIALAEALQSRRPALLALQVKTGALGLWIDGKFHSGDKSLANNSAIDAGDLRQKSRLIGDAPDDILLAFYPPPPRLIILGAVHIATYLTPMAQACGYEVHIIDPRAAWLNREVIKSLGAVLHDSWSDAALADINPDSHSAFVALTHDPKLDDPAFAYLFGDKKTDCFYIGALGSTKTHAKRCDRLKQIGVNNADLSCIHAPIGLSIGAANPAEIAVAIMAQITEALRKPNERP